MADVGYWAIALTLIVSVYTLVASILGERRKSLALRDSARNGAFAAGAAATVASVALFYLLLTRDFSVQYVYEHVSRDLPTMYALSAFWAGQEGSLLIWLWFATLLTAAVEMGNRFRGATSRPYVLAVMAFSQAFLALVLLAVSNPFAVLDRLPLEGRSLNPLLQNFWMVAHPPVIFMGYAAYTVPFALAIEGLIKKEFGTEWMHAVRSWALWAWLFLGAGILMGAWWAYLELGWGGYWGWDPVENASLIPWLTGTALLHSLMMQQRRKAFRTWTLWLIALTFLLCVFATFVTRSGIIQSVHAFGRSAVGYYFLAFIGICLVFFSFLLSLRHREIRSHQELKEPLSREASLLLTNLLLCGTALVVLFGTLFPTLTEMLQGRQAALDASFYERTVGPLTQLVIVLIGLCPWLAWGGISVARLRRDLLPPLVAAVAAAILLLLLGVREVVALLSFSISTFVVVSLLAIFYRDLVARLRNTKESPPRAVWKLVRRSHRRYGAHVVHLGIVLIAIGISGSSAYQDEVQISLAPGEQVAVHGYTLEYQEFVVEGLTAKQLFQVVLDVYRGPRKIATLTPEKSLYWNIEQWVTEVAIRSSLKEDLYVILAGFEEDGLASLRVLVNPLVIWLWIGGAAMLVGGTMAWWPSTRKRRRS